MNIRARIFARKITLIYFYETYFMLEAGEKANMISEIDKVTKVVNPHPEEGNEEVSIENVTRTYYENTDQEIAYIISQHFAKIAPEDIDFAYIDTIAPHFADYKDRVKNAVDTYATSFGFEDMDIMDRVLFTLGYIEYDLLDTPKEVLLNEMVELGKRYGDEASPKLLNGIGHKVLMQIDVDKGVPVEAKSAKAKVEKKPTKEVEKKSTTKKQK